MRPEMNAPDDGQLRQSRTLLVENLLELNEDIVLDLVRRRMEAGSDPFQIIEDAQEGMRLVGLRYEQRQYYISGMMMAGEIFREVMELMQPALLSRAQATVSGHILLGTVGGDIHDIGKSIFATLLRANGFTVTDLGVDVPPEQFAAEIRRLRPDILGLAGVLTVSYDSMQATVQRVRQLEEPELAQTPVIIGGGTVNDMVCRYVGADYWATDAMVGVQLCKQIMLGGISNGSAPGL
jgi:methanogenic corrinoid protein MtbC1